MHLVFQLFFAGPVIFAGCSKGHSTANMLQLPHWQDTHQKIGLALLILYVLQVVIGLVIHFFKTPSLFGGHRPPQNYLHVSIGLAILALAAYQVSFFFRGSISTPYAHESFDTSIFPDTLWPIHRMGGAVEWCPRDSHFG